jgi:hypothetical protein
METKDKNEQKLQTRPAVSKNEGKEGVNKTISGKMPKPVKRNFLLRLL